MFKIFKFLNSLPIPHKKRFIILQFGIIFSNFLEIFSISLLSPYMSLILDKSLINSNYFFNSLYELMSFEDYDHFIIFLGISIFIIIVLSTILLVLITYFGKVAINGLTNVILTSLYSHYIELDYKKYAEVKYSKSSITNNLIIQVIRFTNTSLLSFFEINKKLFLIIFTILILLYFQPILSFFILIFAIFSFAIVYLFLSKKLQTKGKFLTKINDLRVSNINESFNAIREVKFLGAEKVLTKEFFQNNIKMLNTDKFIYMAAHIPKYLIETISVMMMLFIIMYFYFFDISGSNLIVILTLLGVAAYKILPAINNLIFNFNILNGNIDSFNSLSKEIEIIFEKNSNKKNNNIDENREQPKNNIENLNEIEFRNLQFSYNQKKDLAINLKSLNINLNQNTFIIGQSGSGKSTFLDILAGIIRMDSGEIVINKSIKIKSTKDLQKYFSYIPQHINFFNRNLIENISLSFLNNSESDIEWVVEILTMLKLDNLIQDLPDGLYSNLGENLDQLSGGQRQRISIARAIYQKKPILILDEATSALDQETEKFVFSAINNLSFIKSMICSTHRSFSINKNDRVIKFDNGSIIFDSYHKDFLQN